MKAKFCVKCGTEENLINEFCRGCFSCENTLLKHFKDLKIVICHNCKNYLYRNSWQEKLSDDLTTCIKEVTKELFSKKIVINSDVDLNNLEIEVEVPKKLKVSRGNFVNLNLGVDVAGEIEKVKMEEHYEVPLKIQFSMCNNCKRSGGKYFEAKLQIRPKDEKILEYVKEYCDGRKNLFISKIEEIKQGYDLYMNSQKETRSLGNLLRKRFNGEVKESKKLFGRKDGRDVYRATVLFRLEE
ncbi:MAG: hypothetical protein CMH64_03220 [Nanoarchaeota archaeon]|nr:hypothetical protein [Nanoarchaeota archaeon]|tara:strand:+ start:3622 stop:4344 length:723 start_codon:yes stop_codon:yes gene_type:complete